MALEWTYSEDATQKSKVSYLYFESFQKVEFSYKIQIPTNSHRVWVACGYIQ